MDVTLPMTVSIEPESAARARMINGVTTPRRTAYSVIVCPSLRLRRMRKCGMRESCFRPLATAIPRKGVIGREMTLV